MNILVSTDLFRTVVGGIGEQANQVARQAYLALEKVQTQYHPEYITIDVHNWRHLIDKYERAVEKGTLDYSTFD